MQASGTSDSGPVVPLLMRNRPPAVEGRGDDELADVELRPDTVRENGGVGWRENRGRIEGCGEGGRRKGGSRGLYTKNEGRGGVGRKLEEEKIGEREV